MSLTAALGSVTPPPSSPPPIKVAIIGAGAAGLVTARIFNRNGIEPIILEKDAQNTSRRIEFGPLEPHKL